MMLEFAFRHEFRAKHCIHIELFSCRLERTIDNGNGKLQNIIDMMDLSMETQYISKFDHLELRNRTSCEICYLYLYC